MPFSPLGIYVGLAQSELDEIRAAALERAKNGSRTSLSGGQKSGSKEWVDPRETLAEVNYAEQQNGTRAPRAQKVVQILSSPYPTANWPYNP